MPLLLALVDDFWLRKNALIGFASLFSFSDEDSFPLGETFSAVFGGVVFSRLIDFGDNDFKGVVLAFFCGVDFSFFMSTFSFFMSIFSFFPGGDLKQNYMNEKLRKRRKISVTHSDFLSALLLPFSSSLELLEIIRRRFDGFFSLLAPFFVSFLVSLLRNKTLVRL